MSLMRILRAISMTEGVSFLILLLIAMPLEEAGLAAQFGERYLEYRRAVRWRLIPYIH